MINVSVTEQNGRLAVSSPYHPDFAPRAKKLGGKWDSARKTWTFDPRDRERVSALLVSIYGSEGSPVSATDLLTIRAPVAVCDGGGIDLAYYLAGRQVARARGRDSGATLGDGVICLVGGFSSGGSMKNPRITARDGTIVEVRDVPRAAAEKIHAEYHGVTLLDAAGVVVAEPTTEPVAPSIAVVAELASIEIDRTAELATVENEIAAAEGRLAGLRFRAAEIREAA